MKSQSLAGPGAVPTPGYGERICRYVPIVGWIAASALEQRRFGPTTRSLYGQIQQRSETSVSVWGDVRQRRIIGVAVSKSIARHFGWPNHFFIPDDPIALLFWDDDGASSSVLREAASLIGADKDSFDRAFSTAVCSMSLGEFVDGLMRFASENPKKDRR
jgi:hypothetical protein